jgi:uncharacterized protein (DUF1697 family)
MPTSHVAFLRAINVAGHATVAMESLRRAFERWGYRGVRTYIQSGNVLFDAPAEDAEVVARDLESRLGRLLGGEAVVCLRALAQVERLLRRDPFADLAEERGSKLYVSFLRRLPARRPRLPLAREKDGLEIVGREGRDVWVVSRPVKGRYGFPNLLVEEAFGVPATSRNWTTVRAIPARAREP